MVQLVGTEVAHVVFEGAHVEFPPEIFNGSSVQLHEGGERGDVAGCELEIAPANLGIDVLFNFGSHVEGGLRYEDHVTSDLVLIECYILVENQDGQLDCFFQKLMLFSGL